MRSDEPIELRHDCEAVLIPSGEKCRLAAGSKVWITQSLGGNYTVMTDRGSMVRIAEKDSDALGVETALMAGDATATLAKGRADVEKLVWEQLKSCFDPEIPVNIVDLGLVYHCRATSSADGGDRVEIQFTLTAPGCGMGQLLKEDIRKKVLLVPGVKDVDVQLVWDPPWNQSMMSGQARVRLGMV
jgi:probable FeS assembly SUF system protein SufT